MRFRLLLTFLTGLVMAFGPITTPDSIHAEPYFQGKTITIILGTQPGGRRHVGHCPFG